MKVPNLYRERTGIMASTELDGNNGVFRVPYRSYIFTVVASDGEGWEHVSVSLPNRCPNWEEMCFIKDLFWDDNECVVQYHPPKSEYVNNHNYCLHLWKKVGHEFETPPSELVGVKNV